MTAESPFQIAAIQATPVFLNRDATVAKACELIAVAGSQGARLAVFPECFIPSYPMWIWFVPAGDAKTLRELYTELLDNAINVPGPETDRLCAAAKSAGITVAIGINERNTEASGTSLFNTLLFIGPDGNIVGKHRKLIPTAGERLIHAQGDGSTLGVYDMPFGKLGGLICWENYMPLARFALAAWGEQIHVAPTWDRGEPWTSTMRHVAKESRAYVVGCCSAVHRDSIPDVYDFKSKYLPEKLTWVNPGGSMIVDPDGKFLVEPVLEREEILIATVDPKQLKGPRYQLDIAGHYGRPDVFELIVHRRERPAIRTMIDNPIEPHEE